MFSTLLKREIIILSTLNLSSVNAFNLAKPQILLFGKELKDFFLKVVKIQDCLVNGKEKGFNPLPDDKILDWFKLKQIADVLKCI